MTSAALLPPVKAPPVEATTASARRRRQVQIAAVTSLVVLISAACVWALYHQLHPVIGRRALAWSLLFAFVPVLPLSAVFIWLDRLRPEPRWLLGVALLYGGLVATLVSLELNGWLAGLIGDRSGATPRSAVFVAPWVEEAAKAAIIFLIVVWRRHDFNAVVAGVVYGGLVGIGFAFTENIVYYGQLFQQVLASAESIGAALDAGAAACSSGAASRLRSCIRCSR